MPNFFMIQGNLGAGKTLIASVLAQSWRVRSGGNVRLFANYEMLNSTVFDSPSRWLEVADARGSVNLWDEAQTQFDRRTWSRNTFSTQVFNFTRKLRAVHVFINPVGSNLDQRILDFIEIFIHVKKYPGRGIGLDIYEYQDKRYGDWGRLIKRAFIPWGKVLQIFKLDLYDTDAILYPFPMPKTEREQIKLLSDIIEAQQNAALRERKGVEIETDLAGWINVSDHRGQKDSDTDHGIDEAKSAAPGLLVPFHTS